MDEELLASEWKDWSGGKCPVAPDARVRVKLRSREAAGAPPLELLARDLNWRFNNDPGDIIAYQARQGPADQ